MVFEKQISGCNQLICKEKGGNDFFWVHLESVNNFPISFLFSGNDTEKEQEHNNNNNIDSMTIKEEEHDTDSDLDIQSSLGTQSRSISSWYPCEGQI